MAFSLVALWHPLLLLLAFLLPLSLLLLLPTKNPQARSDGRLPLPPSPRGLPLLGHLPLLGALPHRALRALAAAHGPVMLLRLGCVPTVVVSSAAAAEEVLRTRDLALASRPRMLMAERLLYGRDVAFAPYGEYWRQARRICVLHLLSARRIHSFRRVREQEARAMLAKVAAAAAAGGGGGAVNLSELLIAYTHSIVCRAAFGRAYGFGGDGKLIKKVFADFTELLGTTPVAEFLPWLGWLDKMTGLEKKVKATFRALDNILEEVIEDHHRRRREHGGEKEEAAGDADDHRDFVDVLLDVNERDDEASIRLDMREIKAIIMDMFAAGTDTSYTLIEWTMAELMNHPQELKKAQDEVRAAAAAGASNGEHITEELLETMTYLKAVIKETARLHPPVPLLVPREALEDIDILGHLIPARTRVVVNAWAIGRDSTAWPERAGEFWPERFVGSTVDFRGQDFGLVPFGAGRRSCAGIGFAMAVVELALSSLLYHFNWELPGGQKPAPGSIDMSEKNGLSVHIKSGLVLVAKSCMVAEGP